MRNNFKSQKLAVEYGLGIFVVTVILMGIMVITSRHYTSKIVVSDFKHMANEISDARSLEISYWVNSYLFDLDAYTSSNAVKSGNASTIVSWLQQNTQLRNKDYDYMFFCDREGTTFRDTGLVGEKGGISNRAYYKAIIQNENPFNIGDMVLSKTSGQYVIPVSKAAYDQSGEIVGFFTGMLGLEKLKSEIIDVKICDEGYMFLVDGKNRIIAHPDSKKAYTLLPENSELGKMCSSKQKGSLIHTDENGVRNFVTVNTISGTDGWMSCLVIPVSRMYKASNFSGKLIAALGLITGILILAAVLMAIVGIIRRIDNMKNVVMELSTGDANLTKRFNVKHNNEISLTLKAFNSFMEKLQTIVTSVKEAKEEIISADNGLEKEINSSNDAIVHITKNISEVNSFINEQSISVSGTVSAVTQISDNITSLNLMINEQSATVIEASSAIEQMIGNINSVTNSIEKMSQEYKFLEENTKDGIEKTQIVNNKVQQIYEQSSMLMEANSIIENIASQTNLLAMNAAIEAAHAGESGKGFSVVADEIRKLAENSARQSRRITEELTEIQNGIKDVVSASGASKDVMSTVSERIGTTGMLITQIASAMEEQNEGSKQITEALRLMNISTTNVKGASGQVEEGNTEILKQIKVLDESTLKIKNSMSGITGDSDNLNSASSDLTQIARNLQFSIKEIGEQIDQFKV